MTNYDHIDLPIGTCRLVWADGALEQVLLPNTLKTQLIPAHWKESSAPFTEVINQLKDYFAGKLQQFNLPLRPKGAKGTKSTKCSEGTSFQQSVWQALQDIPYGQTISYKTLAANIHHPKACRAAGNANGKNPISIIIPCHRVIAADASLGGYGGGLPTKRFLLSLERDSQLHL